MISSLFSFKNKLSFVSFVVLASVAIFPVVGVKATKMVEEDFLSQRGLRSLAIHEIGGQYYVVMTDLTVKRLSFEDIKNHLDQRAQGKEKPKSYFEKSRKEVQEERIKKLYPQANTPEFLSEHSLIVK